ncbi:hypothetical protein [Actinoplanes sp. G11-F43]|uniref:hypothetical protein n=1 Tax=Actinoplanes sp. G11-F43 TaxID=3424130 RepID=UPI003D34A83C
MRLRHLVVPSIALALVAGCTDDPPPAGPVAGVPGAASVAPAEVVVTPEVSLDVPPDDQTSFPPRPEIGAGSRLLGLTAAGTGPFEVGEAQAELVDAGAVEGAVAANGCATGSTLLGSPKVRFAAGVLAEVRVTDPEASTADGVTMGADLAAVRAAYPSGTELAGAGGVTGWQVLDGANALLVELTGGRVSAFTAGVAGTVEKNFTGGQAC